jgi:hypothetical protein
MAISTGNRSRSLLFKQGENRYSQTPLIMTQEAIMIDNNPVVTVLNKVLRPQTAKS